MAFQSDSGGLWTGAETVSCTSSVKERGRAQCGVRTRATGSLAAQLCTHCIDARGGPGPCHAGPACPCVEERDRSTIVDMGLCGVSVGFVYVRVKLNWIETILFESLRIGSSPPPFTGREASEINRPR